ncbi:hypothetical protein BH11ACT3_BH11ACT3_02550 [soil metagenome]
MIVRFSVAVTTAAVAVALLAGCSGPTAQPTEPGGGNGSSSDAPSAAPSGENVDTGDAADSGSYVIPPTFPKDVPIIEGDVVFSADLGTGWILWLARDDFNAGYDEAKGLLTEAGYAGETAAQADEGSVGQFTTDMYTITLTAGDDPDYGKAVGYTVVLNG